MPYYIVLILFKPFDLNRFFGILYNLYESYNKWTYTVEGNDAANFDEAHKIIRSWNYDRSDAPIPLGRFYEVDSPRFEQSFSASRPGAAERDDKLKALLEKFI
jgi:hypothetical protein